MSEFGCHYIRVSGPVARGRFTPCTPGESLVQLVLRAARNAAPGDVFLLSRACSSPGQFYNCHPAGAGFDQAVKSTGRGADDGTPNIMISRVRRSRNIMKN